MNVRHKISIYRFYVDYLRAVKKNTDKTEYLFSLSKILFLRDIEGSIRGEKSRNESMLLYLHRIVSAPVRMASERSFAK